jgi:hypothetical protein
VGEPLSREAGRFVLGLLDRLFASCLTPLPGHLTSTLPSRQETLGEREEFFRLVCELTRHIASDIHA